MGCVKLTLASLLLLGLASTACQRAEQKELAEAGDTTAIAVPLPDTGAHKDSPGASGTVTGEPEKEIAVVRATEQPPAARPSPRRPVVAEPREEPSPAPSNEPLEKPREAPSPARAMIPAGTNVFVTTETSLSTKTNQVGDPVAARTAENINVNGQVVIPAGALVEGHVTAIKTAGNPGETAYIDLAFDRVRLANGDWLPVQAALAGKAGEEVKGSANIPRNVAIGAGAGAILGQVIGHDTKSTVIGAVIGAGAGAAAGHATRDTYIVVPSGSRLNIQLTSAVSVPVS
jgi:acetyltransferase-like isoleucine patch superfamily enzyme